MKKKISIAGIIPAAALLFVLPWFFRGQTKPAVTPEDIPLSEQKLTVHFIDVGQGDCELAQLPQGRTMLIDAGDNGHEQDIIDYIDGLNIRKIDYLIATHPHADHIGGMEEIIEKYDIGEVYMPRAEATSKTFEKMLDAIESKKLPVHSAAAGRNIFDFDGVKADFIYPYEGEEHDNLNNYSAVVRLECDKTSFLFMGDAEAEAEGEIMEKGGNVQCDVLKVGHHGSKTSSELSFLQSANPKYAIISCGENNKYGHPHKETLEKLNNIKTEVLRTDILGTIKITTNGNVISVQQ